MGVQVGEFLQRRHEPTDSGSKIVIYHHFPLSPLWHWPIIIINTECINHFSTFIIMASFTFNVLGMVMVISILSTHPCSIFASGYDESVDSAESSPGMKRQTCVHHDLTALGDLCECDSPCQGHPNLMCTVAFSRGDTPTTFVDRYCCFTACESEIVNNERGYYCKAGNEERGDFTAGVIKVPCNPYINSY